MQKYCICTAGLFSIKQYQINLVTTGKYEYSLLRLPKRLRRLLFQNPIPKHLKPALRQHESRKSLKTTNYHYALREARRLAVITEHLFHVGISDINTTFQRSIDHLTNWIDTQTSGYMGYHTSL